ncbi:MAG: nucleotide exchange factor GrpE [Tissierellia bacterium]|nr:nucleotide exchange factor GrpE [Tissierellia bacterium]
MQERDEKRVEDLEDIEDADYVVLEKGSENLEEEVKEDNDSEVEELKNQLVRLSADFANYKKRIEKEKKEYIELGVRKLALDMLPVLDNLELALNSIEEFAKDDEIFKGITIIDDQILEVLKKNGIEAIEAKGEKFDPNLHHAVALVEAEEGESDEVVEVLQKGFKINDIVIRPSMVTVSK